MTFLFFVNIVHFQVLYISFPSLSIQSHTVESKKIYLHLVQCLPYAHNGLSQWAAGRGLGGGWQVGGKLGVGGGFDTRTGVTFDPSYVKLSNVECFIGRFVYCLVFDVGIKLLTWNL